MLFTLDLSNFTMAVNQLGGQPHDILYVNVEEECEHDSVHC